MSILDYVPSGYKLRDLQKDALLDIEASWASHDVIVLRADVGTGKSLILRTVAAWVASFDKSCAIITPRVALQEQYTESFKSTPSLKGAARYKCSTKGIRNCGEMKLVTDTYCPDCPYSKVRKKVQSSRVAIFNFQSYLYSKDPRDVMLLDEAHTLFDQISEQNTLNLWKSRYDFPTDAKNMASILLWLEGVDRQIAKEISALSAEISSLLKEGRQKSDILDVALSFEKLMQEQNRLRRVYNQLKYKDSDLFIEESEDFYRGRKQKLLRIRPKSLENSFNPLLLGKTRKLILASATIDPIYIKKLGLAQKRIKLLDYPSPFEPEDQPIVIDYVGNMSFKYRSKNLPKMAEKIVATREKHLDTKGIVHVTYGMANDLKALLADKLWIVWHDEKNKEEKLKFFKNEADKGTVFVASGMQMGTDLPGPDFGWQAVGRIMYPNMSDKLIAHWYKHDPAWITWLTYSDLVQSCGRINRYYGDKGTTYIWDSCLGNPTKKRWGLYQEAQKYKYIRDSFKNRILWSKQ
jgi:Rad3-related DNA helicase